MDAEKIWQIVMRARVSCRVEPESDVPVLCRYASKLRSGEAYLEVGTWMGCSAIVAALASRPDVTIWTVDSGEFHQAHWHHSPDEYRSILRKNFEQCGVSGQIVVSLEGSLGVDWSDPIHLLFVDGDHSYRGVKADMEKWTLYIPRGGVALFHDYALYDGVRQAVDELVQSGWKRLQGGANIAALSRE